MTLTATVPRLTDDELDALLARCARTDRRKDRVRSKLVNQAHRRHLEAYKLAEGIDLNVTFPECVERAVDDVVTAYPKLRRGQARQILGVGMILARWLDELKRD